jgi:hypothetical protein
MLDMYIYILDILDMYIFRLLRSFPCNGSAEDLIMLKAESAAVQVMRSPAGVFHASCIHTSVLVGFSVPASPPWISTEPFINHY